MESSDAEMPDFPVFHTFTPSAAFRETLKSSGLLSKRRSKAQAAGSTPKSATPDCITPVKQTSKVASAKAITSANDDFKDALEVATPSSKTSSSLFLTPATADIASTRFTPVNTTYEMSCAYTDGEPLPEGKAAKMKRSLSQAISADPNTVGITEPVPSQNPVNLEILQLHDTERVPWATIASIFNHRFDTTSYTPNNIYSRYVRTKHSLLVAHREAHYNRPPSVKINKNGKRIRPVKQKLGFDEDEDVLLVESFEAVKKEFWDHVAIMMKLKGGRQHTKGECQRRWVAL